MKMPWLLRAYAGAFYAFLYVPIAILVIFFLRQLLATASAT